MPNDEQITITLPSELAKRVRSYVGKGRFETELDVIDTALDLLEPEEKHFERWLREEVLPVCEELDNDPAQVVSADEIQAMLDGERRNAIAIEAKAS